MTQQELSDKILEVAQELWEYREGEKKNEEFDDSLEMRFDILQGELENW